VVDGPYAGCSLHLRWFHLLLIQAVRVAMALSGFLDDGRPSGREGRISEGAKNAMYIWSSGTILFPSVHHGSTFS